MALIFKFRIIVQRIVDVICVIIEFSVIEIGVIVIRGVIIGPDGFAFCEAPGAFPDASLIAPGSIRAHSQAAGLAVFQFFLALTPAIRRLAG
jgi:hypothetical protein